MKTLSILFVFLAFAKLNAQEPTPEALVKSFFEAFHKQDTTAMRSLMAEDFQLKSVGKDSSGAVKLTRTPIPQFLKSMASIPKNVTFEERIASYNSQDDGLLAVVTTPYRVYVNESFRHCGTNHFTMMHTKEGWKIIGITDSRTTTDCPSE